MPTSPTPAADLTEEQREERRTRARDLIEERLTETWPAWRRPGRKPNLPLAADIALDALGDLAAELLVDGTMMRALTIRDGVATLELAEATEMVRIFAAGMRGVLDGATNYVEMEMTDGSTGEGFTVTVRRRERPTPHELRQQAEARVEELTAELAVARQLLGTTTSAGPAAVPSTAAMLSTPCDACDHTLNWHRNDVGCTVPRCVCGRFQDPVEAAAPPAPADRAAVLREAAEIAESLREFTPAYGARKSAQISENVGVLRVADHLRRLAGEAAAGVQQTTEAHPPSVEYIAEVLELDESWEYLGAHADPAVAARRRASVTRRHPDAETRTVRKTTTYTVEPTEPPTHLPKGTNAEDCPACKGTNPDYPFLCPGPTPAVVHACPPDGSGLTPCCHRPPFEMQADRMTTDPTAVTCPTPPAAPAAPEEPTP
ncbi:hypothetical protein ASD97_24715 [Streptomyces sp. Root63]|uniref:hypothetical protein n=1 Tax=unclassified Streptomyces TaxID=2593676 RepID=UPI0006F69A3F|nr:MULTISPECIES: hypothetical protein [unclassified Streptomyces]KQX27507.1 hypothetical protein ASD29_29945 [Streptomyces sp. Root1295]KRA34747.1 hypothetical protein ASD97_24715 [Streptomyces sp. Root63]